MCTMATTVFYLGGWWLVDPDPGLVIPKTSQTVRAASLIDAQHFKRERAQTNNYTLATIMQALVGLMTSSCVEVPHKGIYK